MKIIIFLLFYSAALASDPRMDRFFAALAKVESSGNPNAYNPKENAIGIYQIRRAYYLDSRVPGGHAICYNPATARKVCEAYFRRYAPKAFANADFETLARLHNSGPGYAQKKHLTNDYWRKVKKALDSN